MSHQRNRCTRFPNKARYPKAVYAWRVGARQVKKAGIQLYLYKCACGGWHLTKSGGPDATLIETKASPRCEEMKESA